jgi:hypothetical protein
MKMPIKVVCDRCGRTLARFAADCSTWTEHRHKHMVPVYNPQHRTITSDCACSAHIVVKIATIRRRAEAGERVIAV